ncbi:phosphatase PAP2 family protein [Amycolatopsis rubida]|uniref:Phosphatase PAP2 family protein n=1 Tax=Amycolatopsis rubida TaxID=112413 RepID=A0ABX0BX85_9PSEU|nr:MULTISPECIES: phosphatase PAP2 family protein [Amycolatopsis]MYW93765.1 phosphatase PAP2 family protein [Amycolatopsis rubida]NEC58754.1 phosphatase PAP2 family protein [Amycolatopsis rubida]OAP22947.1 undecaprenyl pyrophosphate phosphatase [Amycolatopsis sp. M39]
MVSGARWTGAELRLLDWVHDRTSPPVVSVARVVTVLGETPMVWAVVGASCLARADRRVPRLLTLAAAVRRVTAELVSRERPPERLWRDSWSGPSFPSRHTTLGTLGLALAAANVLPRPAAVTAAVGLSRIVLGVHWPSDILGGWLFAAAALASTRRVRGCCRDRS